MMKDLPLAASLISWGGFSAAAIDDASLGQVVGGHLHGDRIAGQDADVVFAHLAGDVRGHDVAILQFHPESRIGQGLDDLAFHLDRVFFGHSALNGFGGANWSTKRAPVAICSSAEGRARAAARLTGPRAALTACARARAAGPGTGCGGWCGCRESRGGARAAGN